MATRAEYLDSIRATACSIAKAFQELETSDDAAVASALDEAADDADSIIQDINKLYKAEPHLIEMIL